MCKRYISVKFQINKPIKSNQIKGTDFDDIARIGGAGKEDTGEGEEEFGESVDASEHKPDFGGDLAATGNFGVQLLL